VPHIPPRILFVLKRRDLGDGPTTPQTPYSYCDERASGLLNSVRFIVVMLRNSGVDCDVVQVTDNNDIDREVTRFDPTHVVIEALWVVPEKFAVLTKLHPHVQWLVRIHSEIPFLAHEGIAIDWITRYVQYPNVGVAANSIPALTDVRHILRCANPAWSEETLEQKVVYLPNYYPHKEVREFRKGAPLLDVKPEPGILNVGCFGAIRPLKNNLLQAVSAIRYADQEGLKLRFHVNGGRNEQGGDNALKNIRALFAATPHELIEHPWMTHEVFLALLRGFDLSLCVSLSETFCIVAADSVAVGVPTVVSSEVKWASGLASALPTSSGSIVSAIGLALHPWLGKVVKFHNRFGLKGHCDDTREIWLDYFDGCDHCTPSY
jgi:glycosyltransferase involved in cell wall biosynthesis